MASFREELNNYLSIPGALCVVAGGWLYLAAQHCSEEARRVSQAYVLDSLSGPSRKKLCTVALKLITCMPRQLPFFSTTAGRTSGGGAAAAAAAAAAATRQLAAVAAAVQHADARKLERLLPMLVALRGRVDSPDPKQCELSERKCVIYEVRQQRKSSCKQQQQQQQQQLFKQTQNLQM
jgi:hypothetical protein